MGNLRYDCILFDLDGTLVDTLDDLTNSLNRVLSKHGYSNKTRQDVRSFLGNGYRKLIERSTGKNDNKINDILLEEFIIDYSHNCCVYSKPYDGIINLLKFLKDKNIKIAVISNKNDEAVSKIIDSLFGDLIDYSCGMKDGYNTKPNLDIYNDIMTNLKGVFSPIMVGDSEVDIKTAKNAEIDCITVTWGFRNKEDLK